jgi:hypothetical protein
MPRKSWVDKATETNDWSEAVAKAKTQLRKSGAKIFASRVPKDGPEKIFQGIEPDTPEPADAGDDAVQEHVDDGFIEDADELPTDDQEKQLAPVQTSPAVRFAKAYQDYRDRGGNRSLEDRALAYFGPMDIELIDRAAIIAAARKLYPNRSQADRAELVYDPVEEVIACPRLREPKKKRESVETRASDGISPELAERIATFNAKLAKSTKEAMDYLYVLFPGSAPTDEEIREYWARFDRRDYSGDRWASISKPPGPPPDPVPAEPLKIRWSSAADRWRYKHRGLFGHWLPYGCEKRQPSGRPKKPNKLTNAEKQKAYRDRKRAEKEAKKDHDNRARDHGDSGQGAGSVD